MCARAFCIFSLNGTFVHFLKKKKNNDSIMKRLLILSIATLVSMSAFAQTKEPRKVKYIVKGGLTFPKFLYSGKNDVSTVRSNTEFYVGALASVPVCKTLSVQSGLSLVGKGNRAAYANYVEYIDLLYLEIPANLIATFDAGKTGSVFVGAGPYLGFGLRGGIRKDYRGDIPTEFEDITFGNSPNMYQGVDFGFNFLLGYQLKNGFGVNGGYNLGITNVYNDPTTEQKIMNSGFSIGLSFAF